MNELETILKIINLFQTPIVISRNHRIIVANDAAKRYAPNIHSKSMKELFGYQHDTAAERLQTISTTRKSLPPHLYSIKLSSTHKTTFELRSYYLEIEGRGAVLTKALDVSEKRHAFSQSRLMKQWLLKRNLPHINGMMLHTNYKPCTQNNDAFYFTTSTSKGDRYLFYGTLDKSATVFSLAVSGIAILFDEMVEKSGNITEKLTWFKEKFHAHFGTYKCRGGIVYWETSGDQFYVANFSTKAFLLFDDANCTVDVRVLNGALGDKNDSAVSIERFQKSKYRYLLLGSEEALKNTCVTEAYNENLYALAQGISSRPIPQLFWIGIDMHYQGAVNHYLIEGLHDFDFEINRILGDLNLTEHFAVRLAMTELVSNAYKHGNDGDATLPIFITVSVDAAAYYISVQDMCIVPKSIKINYPDDESLLLNESGRGLFLVSQFSEELYHDFCSVTVKILHKEALE
ncbi:ATP-binding protein [Fusibacter sp. JL298sf-3]